MNTITYCLFFLPSLLLSNQNISIEVLENIYPNEDQSMRIALFALGVLAILALFLSSLRIHSFKKETAKTNKLKEDVQKQHNQMLSNMGENIQSIAEENRDVAKKLSFSHSTHSINKSMHSMEHAENKLLSIATNLIEFLRLKSKKVKILHERISLSNLLDDVSGSLKELLKETPLELHYIIKSNIKDTIYADTLNLSKILINIVLYCVENKANILLLDISSSNNFSNNNQLFFTLSTNIKLNAHNSDSIFHADYDEKTGRYKSLGLFVARELSQLMGGNLIARNDKDENLEFYFDISYTMDIQEIQISPIKPKQVLIVDRSENAVLASKNIFEGLGHKVSLCKAQEYLYKLPDFSKYDLILLDEMLFTKKTLDALKASHTIISLSNLFTSPKKEQTSYTKLSLQKPLTSKQVEELLHTLYVESKERDIGISSDTNRSSTAPVHKETFLDFKDITLQNFSKFRETNILLVEDNFINQKVLLGILSKSGINIVLANNGQEALDRLEEDILFHLVFMDINMPVMDGFTATKHIRKNKKHNALPIVALTALGSKLEIASMFDVGMNAYLTKPLKKEKLFSALSMFIVDKKNERRQSIRYEERTIKLNGLDIELGIRNSNSNDFFYKEILKEFQDAYGTSDVLFEKLIQDFRYEQLRMLCVDLRGLCASIGAQDLHLLAEEVLKLLLFKKYEILKDFVALYAKSLARLNTSIDQYIKL